MITTHIYINSMSLEQPAINTNDQSLDISHKKNDEPIYKILKDIHKTDEKNILLSHIIKCLNDKKYSNFQLLMQKPNYLEIIKKTLNLDKNITVEQYNTINSKIFKDILQDNNKLIYCKIQEIIANKECNIIIKHIAQALYNQQGKSKICKNIALQQIIYSLKHTDRYNSNDHCLYNTTNKYILNSMIVSQANILMKKYINYNSELRKKYQTLFTLSILIYYELIGQIKVLTQQLHDDKIYIIEDNRINLHNIIDEELKKLLDNDKINSLKQEISQTPADDIGHNLIIMYVITNIMKKLFPNYKDLHKAFQAKKNIHENEILLIKNIDFTKYNSTQNLDLIKQHISSLLTEYNQNSDIKDSFIDPMLEIDNNDDKKQFALHSLIFNNFCFEELDVKKAYNKISYIFQLMHREIILYHDLLLTLKNQKKNQPYNDLNVTMVVLHKNKMGFTIYRVPNFHISLDCKYINLFSYYAIIIYSVIAKKINNKHTYISKFNFKTDLLFVEGRRLSKKIALLTWPYYHSNNIRLKI